MKKKLAIITTHPIQYYAPVFQTMAHSDLVEPRVFYTWSQTAAGNVLDVGFGTKFTWDIPLLTGYDHEFVENVAKQPGSEHFFGVQNPSLCNRIDAWGADAVLVYGWNLHSHLHALRYFSGRVPVFFRGDSTLLDKRSRLRGFARRRFLRWLYNHVDVAISVGQNNRDYYSWCGLPDDRIAFAPHSIDNRRFADPQSVAERHAADWRAKLNIPDDAIVFLFAGKFVPKKAPELLLESFLKTRMPAHLIFLGNGELEGKLRQRAAGHDNVHFIPFQNQSAMPTVYRLADVFVLPSCGPGETWGLAINEAMACGRAVVASTKVGGARDLVQPAVNGWIFESGNAVELESLVANIVDSGKERLRSMGANGQSLIQRWSTEACAQQMSEVIHANA